MSNSLQNIENYKLVFDYSTTEICSKYFRLLNEYLLQCVDSIYMKNKTYYKYIICKGVDTISHVFKIMLLYTKNLDLTFFHCQKSFYYYVEFIGQIGDNNHSFLQLNSKDAALFVYKKTIFEINNEYRMDFKSEIDTNIIMNNIEIILEIYNSCFSDIIQNLTEELHEKHRILQTMNDKITKLSQYILELGNQCDEDTIHEKLNLIKLLNEYYLSKGIKRIHYIEILCRKLKKYNITKNNLNDKLLLEKNDIMYENVTPLRYINWLMLDDDDVSDVSCQ
jgi:hypothetical protein